MRCLKCEYPLWDLKPGPCPECGEPFDSMRHEFRPNAVRFCCPHCDQAYYGTGEGGHLQPRSFDCVGCRTRIDESECVIRPLEGVDRGQSVHPGRTPWFDDSLGWFKRVLRTIGWSIVAPARLGRGLPVSTGLGSGLAFAAIVQGLVVVTGMVTLAALFGMMMSGLGGRAGVPGGQFLVAVAMPMALLVVAFVLALLGVLLLGSVAHGVLRITGPTKGGIGRTIASFGFGTGPTILAAVPLLGFYCLGTVGGIWALVSTILILCGAQGVSGLRATIAVLVAGALAVVLYVGIFISLIFGVSRGAMPAPGIAGPATFATRTELRGDPAYLFHGVSPLPDPVAAAAMMPDVFDANAETIDLVGNGYAGWCQAGELILRRDDGYMLHAALSPDARSLTIVFTDDGFNGGSTSVSPFPPIDASGVRDAIADRLGDGNLVGEDLTVESMQAWIDLTLRGTDGP